MNAACFIEIAAVDDFHKFLLTAKPGQQHIYWTGNLAKAVHDQLEAWMLRDMAWNAQSNRVVCLTQRRVGPESCAYIATKAL
jgi:hypothetical protein